MPDPQTGIAVAAAAIAANFPSISTARLTHLGSGWDFDAFLTADGWVFRFPLRADCVTTLDTERRVHALLADVLPASVAVPRVELVAEPNAAFQLRFDGHRYLPGVHADAIPANLLPATARSIGEALGAIHTVPEAAARAAGVRPFDENNTGWLEWLEQRIASVNEVRGIDPGVDDAIDWVRSQSAVDASPVPESPRLIHNDLSPEHLLVDPATGQLIGILDWSDVALGDPVRDVAPLAASHGWRFVREVIAHYPVSVDDAFWQRLQFLARLCSVLWLVDAHRQGTDVPKHVGWVRNAFAGGERDG